MLYFQKLVFIVLSILLSFFLIQCSDNPKPKQIPPVPVEQAEVTGHIRVLNEIPQYIQSVDSLSIFPGDSEPLYSVELIPVLSFGKTGKPYLIQVLDVVEDAKGRVHQVGQLETIPKNWRRSITNGSSKMRSGVPPHFL